MTSCWHWRMRRRWKRRARVRLWSIARTKVEGYRPPAHWEWIARIRESVSIPVIANGEVWTVDDHRRCREVSGCEDVMIGRGLIANPFLALQIKGLRGHEAHDRCWPEVLWLVLEYHRLVMQRIQPRHVHGRTKQWLQMMKRYYPKLSFCLPNCVPSVMRRPLNACLSENQTASVSIRIGNRREPQWP